MANEGGFEGGANTPERQLHPEVVSVIEVTADTAAWNMREAVSDALTSYAKGEQTREEAEAAIRGIVSNSLDVITDGLVMKMHELGIKKPGEPHQ